jgi:hypothetical protein
LAWDPVPYRPNRLKQRGEDKGPIPEGNEGKHHNRLGPDTDIDGAERVHAGLTPKLSDVGGPARPYWQLRWSARVRCRVGAGLAPDAPTDPYVNNSRIKCGVKGQKGCIHWGFRISCATFYLRATRS